MTFHWNLSQLVIDMERDMVLLSFYFDKRAFYAVTLIISSCSSLRPSRSYLEALESILIGFYRKSKSGFSEDFTAPPINSSHFMTLIENIFHRDMISESRDRYIIPS